MKGTIVQSIDHVLSINKQSRVSIPLCLAPLPTQKIRPLPKLVDTDGVARYRDFVFGDYLNNFHDNTHEGKKYSLDFAKMVTSQ